MTKPERQGDFLEPRHLRRGLREATPIEEKTPWLTESEESMERTNSSPQEKQRRTSGTHPDTDSVLDIDCMNALSTDTPHVRLTRSMLKERIRLGNEKAVSDSDDESDLQTEINNGEIQFPFGETQHLQTIMSNQISFDLTKSPSDYKPAVPTTTKFALPKPPHSAVEGILGQSSPSNFISSSIDIGDSTSANRNDQSWICGGVNSVVEVEETEV